MLFSFLSIGRKDDMPLPEPWSNFTEKEETYDPEHKMIVSVKKHYDYSDMVARVDFVAPKHSRYGMNLPNHHFAL